MSESGIDFLLPEVENPEPDSKHIPRKSDPVFYNPKQALNRDLSIMVLHAVKELNISKIERVVETFAGTGVRALRYALQIPDIQKLYINDISPRSIELTKKNFELHQDKHKAKLRYYNQDANLFFLKLREEDIFLDFVDIDPYGTPSPFLHNAILTLEKSGILAVTATDMPVLTGKFPEKAYRLYQIPGYKVANRSYCHEIGLRMLIAYVQREGFFYKKRFVPLLSFYADHYVRVFFHQDSSSTIDKIIQSHGYVTDCTHCGKRDFFFWKESFSHKRICSNCSTSVRPIGPIYLGPLHTNTVVDKLQGYLQTFPKQNLIDRRQRLDRLVPLFKEDLKITQPWYYELGNISKKHKFSIPSPQYLVDKLLEHGQQASLTHFNGQAIRTDYPIEIEVKKFFQ